MKPFLEELEETVHIDEAGDLNEAVRVIEKGSLPQLVLLDMKMPGMDGANGIRKVISAAPGAKIVVVSGQFGRKDIMSAIDAGASGYIPKTMAGRAMTNALRLVLGGETYLPAALLAAEAENTLNDALDSDSPLARLTPRETEILGLLIDGNTNKEIAREIGVEEITVKIHLRNVYKKLAASNRADAVRIALQNGWNT